MNTDEKGFSVVELLLLIIIVILVAFAGWYIYHTDHKTTTSSTSTKTTATTNETAAAAGARAVSIITAFNAATIGTPTTEGITPVTYVDNNANNGYFTTSFVTSINNGFPINQSGEEGISCSDNFTGAFGVDSTTLNGSSATVLLSLLSSSGVNETTSYSMLPKVTLQYVNGNWSVNGYSCVSNPS